EGGFGGGGGAAGAARNQRMDPPPENLQMNKVPRRNELNVPKVTTGPLSASRKIYVSLPGYPDVRVPLREITLSPASGEGAARVYDPSGPYTDAEATIDVERGLPAIRTPWVLERGCGEPYAGREVRPEDNGRVGKDRL